MRFGVCFAPDPPPRHWVDLARLAEDNGFGHVWMWDSHVLWQEVYPIFAMMASETERIRIGPLVTNPITRDPTVTASVLATLNDLSGGRMDMGIGRGDSARRVIGQKPVTVEQMEHAQPFVQEIREQELRLAAQRGPQLRVEVRVLRHDFIELAEQ
jgi:alkanesulfonate monooxygenase SsuD/methylene tetrahydromethanopterin reductase-like flavin-dependent oxidoreductase (luciferase family)